jgi:tetratricopeptide (TPR) repeat protein
VTLSGKFDEAEREFEAAMRLDPKLFEAPYYYGRARKAQGRLADAAKLFERAEMVRPEDYQSPGLLVDVYEGMGLVAEAAEARRRTAKVIASWLELNPDDARACVFGAINLAALGDSEGAQALATRAMAVDPDDPMLLYNIACMYARLGKPEEALRHLEISVDKGMGHKDWIAHDGDLESIRESPRYKAILEAM